ncbi:putative ribonuclease H-like domain-containing protein [Tanacetum coccineum]
MVGQGQIEMGKGSEQPTDAQHTPSFDISSSKPKKKTQKHRKAKDKATKVPHPSGPPKSVADKAIRVNIPGSDENTIELKELMKLCTKVPKKVLDLESELEKTKSSHKLKVESLERRVKKLERRNKSRTKKLKGLYKIGLTAKVDTSDDEEPAMDEEDTSKQGRIIAEIDINDDIILVNVQDEGTMNINDDVMVDEVAKEVVEVMEIAKLIVDEVSTAGVKEVSTASEEPVSAAHTNITAAQLRETTSKNVEVTQVFRRRREPEIPKTRKHQIQADVDLAKKLVDEEQAQFEKEQRIEQEKALKVFEENEALINIWEEIQAKIDADAELARKLDAEEQQQYTDAEKAKLFMEFIEKRRKYFARKGEFEKRNKPPTKAQQRKIMIEDEKEVNELKQNMEIVPDDGDDVTIETIPLSSKSPTIVKYKIYKEGKKQYFQIFRVDGSSQMLEEFSNEPKIEKSKDKSSDVESESVRKCNEAPIIEDWVSDDEEEKVEKNEVKPSFKKIEFVKATTDNKTRETIKNAEQPNQNTYRKRGNQRNWNGMMSHRNQVPKAALTVNAARQNLSKAALIVNTVGPIATAVPKRTMNAVNKMSHFSSQTHSIVYKPIQMQTAPKNIPTTKRVKTVRRNVNAVKGKRGNAVKASACWVWKPKTKVLDHGNPQIIRRFMGDMLPLEEIPKEGRLLEENSVLFTDTECIVLSPDLKLIDENQILLRATKDESKIWHRRLGHLDFKTINKLVKGNLVRGLPSKIFKNDQSCVACQKGKQHRASCKTKVENSIFHPLHLLHMDLFGPTFVKSLNKKMYCLVVTDDYSRFTWVFFLRTKDETSGILKSFITRVENLMDHKVKIIRCDNGTEFKNKEMNQFCEVKGILKQFSVARTPQQNGVAERRNRTLSYQDDEFQPLNDGEKKVDEEPRKEDKCTNQREEDSTNNTNRVNTVSSNINTASSSGINAIGISIDLPDDLNMPELEEIGIFKDASYD